MPAVTGNTIVGDAFALLNVFLPGESVPPADGQIVLRFLNDILGELSQRGRTAPFVARDQFPLVAGKGGLSNPYTIGPTGDFAVARPENQSAITGANLVLTASTPSVRVGLGVFTDDAYAESPVPDLNSGQPTGIYYNPTYQNDLGSIFLWPVPNTALNALELFIASSVAAFPNLTATVYLPDGMPRLLKYMLADALQVPYGKALSPAAAKIAATSLGVFQRSNTHLSDLSNDASFGSRRGGYNIETGQ